MPSLARNTVFNAVGSAAMLGSGFLTTLIAARLLGPEAVGVVAFATLIITFALAILDLGLPGAMTRFMPEFRRSGALHDRKVAARILAPYTLLSAVSALLLYAALILSGADLGPSSHLMAGLIAGGAFVQSLSAFHYGVLKGQQKFAQFAVLTTLCGVSQIGLAVAGALHFGVPGILAANVIAYSIPAAASLMRLRYAAGGSETGTLHRLLIYSAQTWAIYVFTTISWSRLEVYFLRKDWGDHAAGMFSAGSNLANIALQGPMFLTGALLPYLATRHVDDPGSLPRVFARALRYFALAVIPMTFGAAALCPLLLPLLYGAQFADAVTSATILVAANASMAVIAIVQQFAFATDRARPLLVWSAVTAALTVISGFTLIAHFGLLGAAVGRALLLAASALALLVLARRWRWPVPWATLTVIVFVSGAGALILSRALRP